jgi:hypothetical protein
MSRAPIHAPAVSGAGCDWPPPAGIPAAEQQLYARLDKKRNAVGRYGRQEDATMDDDLANLDRESLIAEVKKLRAGIRAHRDSSGHDLCWHHPELWGLLPEKSDPLPSVPAWPQFLRGCLKYRESLDRDLPHALRMSDEFADDERRGR